MFNLAILLGIYSYCIFALGLLHLLYKEAVFIITLLFIFCLFLWKADTIQRHFKKIFLLINKGNLWITLPLAILFIQASINLIGALAPELAFDALWYHLTFPKLYLFNHAIYHIPGGLLYYSDMPKLGEMLYVGALSVGNEIIAKLVHFTFGILISIAIYKIARIFFSPLISLISVVVFYGNLVVAWESTTAYIDLIRTFFEVLALWAIILWYQTDRKKWIVISAIMMGLAITTKLLSFGSLIIFLVLLLFGAFQKKKFLKGIKYCILYVIISLTIPFPWLLFATLHTGNPFYPFFSNLYEITPMSLNLLYFFNDVWILFTQASDPISPVYIMFFPFIIYFYRRFSKEIQLLILFSMLSIILWYFTPRTGGGRFILPYLPLFSIVCVAVIAKLFTLKKTLFAYSLITLILFVSMLSIGYRTIASAKYFPVVLKAEAEDIFIAKNLNYGYGDFYDIDGMFAKTIKKDQTVLLYGFHNLYYVNFPFIDSSWVQKGNTFDYIATQNTTLPQRFKNWELIYTNEQTLVKLYKPPKGGCRQNVCVY